MWDRLGIQPTGDRKTIKRAYTKLLRQYHPEEDPEGFQRLREAYEFALSQVDRHVEQHVEPAPQAAPEQDLEPLAVTLDESARQATPPSDQVLINDAEPEAEPVDLEFNQALELLRLAVESEDAMPFWTELLERLNDMPLTKRGHFEYPLVYALVQPSKLDPEYCHLAILPRWYVWSLNDLFHWREENLHLARFLHPDDFERMSYWLQDLDRVTTRNILEDLESLILDKGRGSDPYCWQPLLNMLIGLDSSLRAMIRKEALVLLLSYAEQCAKGGNAYIPQDILASLDQLIGFRATAFRRWSLSRLEQKLNTGGILEHMLIRAGQQTYAHHREPVEPSLFSQQARLQYGTFPWIWRLVKLAVSNFYKFAYLAIVFGFAAMMLFYMLGPILAGLAS